MVAVATSVVWLVAATTVTINNKIMDGVLPLESVPAANNGRDDRGNETEYFLSKVQDSSVWLKTSYIQRILTRCDMVITPSAPIRPQPPAIYMVPSPVVLSGLEDGYTWHGTRSYHLYIDRVPVIYVTTSNTQEFNNQTIVRRIYRLMGQNQRDRLLVHYKVKGLEDGQEDEV